MSPASYLTAPPRVAGGDCSAALRRANETDGAADARPTEAAVAVRVLRQVLLVVVLGVVERPCRRDLRRDLAVARAPQLALVHLARALGRLPLLLVLVEDRRAV